MLSLRSVIVLLLFLFSASISFGQDTVTVMTYNLLNYPGSDAAARNPYFRTIMSATDPDILIVQEMQNQGGVNLFLNSVLNFSSANYAAGTFIDGPDSDNAIFFKTSKFSFTGNTPIKTALRDISQFSLEHKSTNIPLYVYSVHLKASSGSFNMQLRAAEVDSLRKITDNHSLGTSFIVTGDFNLYNFSEPAYQKLLFTEPGKEGHVIDPLPLLGDWNSAANAPYHTQSPRVRSFGGGSNGGLDDRFDLMLFSAEINRGTELAYLENSMTAYGNDGNHFNDSINRAPNTAVGQIIADALHYASDHLPVVGKFIFKQASTYVQLISLYAFEFENAVHVEWQTGMEVQHAGFVVERQLSTGTWDSLALVQYPVAHNPGYYHFVDQNIFYHGTRFYRLKMIDYSGSFTYSLPVSVEIKNRDRKLFAYPVPANHFVELELPPVLQNDFTVTVYSPLGQTLLMNHKSEMRNNRIQLDISDLPPGIYYVLLSSEKARFTGSFTKGAH